MFIVEIATLLRVSQSTIQPWNKRTDVQTRLNVRPERRKLTVAQEQATIEFLRRKPGSCQDEIVEYVAQSYSIAVSSRTIPKTIRRID